MTVDDKIESPNASRAVDLVPTELKTIDIGRYCPRNATTAPSTPIIGLVEEGQCNPTEKK